MKTLLALGIFIVAIVAWFGIEIAIAAGIIAFNHFAWPVFTVVVWMVLGTIVYAAFSGKMR